MDPTPLLAYRTNTENYTTVNATGEEIYYDRWGLSVENWKNKSRVVVPADYTAPECFYYVSVTRPSLVKISASVDLEETAFTLELYRCQTCGYVASLCKTMRSFDLVNKRMQDYEIQIDVYSCIVIRLYSSSFPLFVYRSYSSQNSYKPVVSLDFQTLPPTCACEPCKAGDRPLPILRTSYNFTAAWMSRPRYSASLPSPRQPT